MNRNKIKLRLFLSFLHAIWLLILSFWLLNWQFVHWDEGEIIQFGPVLKKLILNWETKPPQEDLMFINVSHDYQLAELTDEFGFPIGNEAITDREKLAQILSILGESNTHKGIICDIRFDLPSSQDAELEKSFKSVERIYVSNHLENNIPTPMVIQAPNGISDYPISGGGFFKFKYLINDSIKTVPLLLHETLSNTTFEKAGPFISDGKLNYLNVFLTDLLVRPHDLFESENHYFYENLGTLLFLPKEDIVSIAKDKIIVIGDFEKYDKHSTLLGEMPGPLILLNAYLSLATHKNKLQFLEIAFLLACYFIISTLLIFPEDPIEKIIRHTTKNNQLASAIAGFFSYFLLLILTVLFSYLFFDLLLNVLWLTFYLMALDKLISIYYKKKKAA